MEMKAGWQASTKYCSNEQPNVQIEDLYYRSFLSNSVGSSKTCTVLCSKHFKCILLKCYMFLVAFQLCQNVLYDLCKYIRYWMVQILDYTQNKKNSVCLVRM